ncbi:LLM class flavin-dependent oxidoreductase [Pseudogracilibacillus auburnensis]|uniref:Luciferase family oxidoreductase group 1 n=1 Tax=Pseudogracilibacillus auburnensis TaxID=1494959 RepID=A0A2V3WB42_9BACI|nr:LLM class flavin-dependent oxidoreductase [Pseudogracilibacillus auburnensis]PXW90231.1 luciferase family oxidoreductase group 1 [Pseudogracilibacillus auburnensis]
MKLSILDQAPISAGKTAQEALQSSVKLAQLGEELGYHRYWIAEHHDLFGLACPNPDVMLGVIGAQTNTIRIGAGAVLLPYYKPFRVAETYHLLATLFPGRIDLGIGRAPGGSAEVSMALSDNYLKQVREYPQQIDELNNFFTHNFPKDHPYGKIKPTPVPPIPLQTWLLGTSEKSAVLAAEKGLDYAFGHFMTNAQGPEVVKLYRKNFRKFHDSHGRVIVAMHVICAETTEKAEKLAESVLLWKVLQEKVTGPHKIPSRDTVKNYSFTTKEKEKIDQLKKKMIIGNPIQVKEKIIALNTQYEANEIMIVTITYDEEAKFISYRLLAEQFKN